MRQVLEYGEEDDLVVEDDSDGGSFVSRWRGAGRGGGVAGGDEDEGEGSDSKSSGSGIKSHALQGERGRGRGGVKRYLALQMQFTLPPAAFATSLVREVSKETVHPADHVERRRQVTRRGEDR
jgi:tRNA(Glu) U13 pseudouridine synthase TruD